MIDLKGHHREIGNANMPFPNDVGRSRAFRRVNRISYIVNFRNITNLIKNPSSNKQLGTIVNGYSLAACAISAGWNTLRFWPKVGRVSYWSPGDYEEIKPNIREYSDFGPPSGYPLPLYRQRVSNHCPPMLFVIHKPKFITQNCRNLPPKTRNFFMQKTYGLILVTILDPGRVMPQPVLPKPWAKAGSNTAFANPVIHQSTYPFLPQAPSAPACPAKPLRRSGVKRRQARSTLSRKKRF